MADINRASARLRKTFHYPDDDDASNSDPETMDEQEQESYIARLSSENASQNINIHKLLLALPPLFSLPYILPLFSSRTRLLSLLALTSLASTFFLLFRLPIASTGFPILDSWTSSTSSHTPTQIESRKERERQRRMKREVMGERSPLEVWLPWLNLGLVGVLAILGFASQEAWKGAFTWIGMGNLPGVVFVVIVVAKMIMGSVDPETELGALKYNYKGA